MYGLPSDAQGFIFAYNKKMFDDAGVKYPTDDWTWDDVVSAAKEITKPGNTWGVLAPTFAALFRGNFVYSAGGSMDLGLGPDSHPQGCASPATGQRQSGRPVRCGKGGDDIRRRLAGGGLATGQGVRVGYRDASQTSEHG